jgi:DNA-binding IclR family transcriptional regulator
VLEATAANGGAATLAQVTRATALARSTAHHLLRALVEFGYLHQDGDARPYRLASKLFGLAGRAWSPEHLADLATSVLDELCRRTGEAASVAVLRDDVVTIVAKRDPDGPVRIVQDVGAARPLHCTAVGKALAAWLPAPRLESLVARTVFERKTARTITTAAAFHREMAAIRRAGYALDNEEHIEGIRCLAVPVRDGSGAVGAALCVLGPKGRFPQRRYAELRKQLAAAATRLSAQLGPGADDRASVKRS